MNNFFIQIYQIFLEIWKELFMRGLKKTVKQLHHVGWEYNHFKSSDVSMLVHSCGVSQFKQFYDRQKKSNFTLSVCGEL